MVVRMRINRSATRMRRSHHGLEGPRLSKCTECGAMRMRHRACNECGAYRGRTVGKQSKKVAKAVVAQTPKKTATKKAPDKKTAKKADKATK